MVEVTAKDESLNKVWLRTYCFNQNNQLVIDGEAIMMPRKEAEVKNRLIVNKEVFKMPYEFKYIRCELENKIMQIVIERRKFLMH